MTQAKLPPHNLDAEQMVLGGLMLDPASWERIVGKVSADDFYQRDHKEIFTAIKKLYEQSKAVDAVTVANDLRTAGNLDDCGGTAYLIALVSETPSAANIATYAGIIQDKAILRRVITAGTQMASDAFNGTDPQEILDQAQRTVLNLSVSNDDDTPKGLGEYVTGWIDALHTQYEAESEITGLPTGFKHLDAKTAGLQPGDLIIIAARPSMGKSALAFNIVEHCADELGKNALIFSLEMSIRQLLTRHVSKRGRIEHERLRSPKRMNQEDFARVSQTIAKIHTSKIYVDELSGIGIHELAARTRRAHRKNPLSLVVVDYLQLMAGNGENRNREIEGITHGLKALAKDLRIPVVALSQISRAGEKREDRRPQLSDMRDSGSIEQDADVIAALYRDEYYHENSAHKGIAELNILKQRNGPTGRIDLGWASEFVSFTDYDGPAWFERIKDQEPRQVNKRGMED